MQQDDRKSQESPDATTAIPAQTSGAVVLGDFELRREIGRGGMGTVYSAWQGSLQRNVALKVLAPHVASTSKAVARFRREAQAAAKLHHMHIVPIYAQGEANGSYFYAMELVEGESLHSSIMNLRSQYRPESVPDHAETVVLPQRSATTTLLQNPGTASPSSSSVRKSGSKSRTDRAFGDESFFREAARHMADVADALQYAHANGVIHRDIKPHNLLFGRDGRLRVSDFGLARFSEQPGVTMTGEVLGSPLYMSPEQITGDPNAVDHRTDIYSLGATMYEWLTLTPPYPGETRERVISRILSSEPLPLRSENPAVPTDLETICLKAIDRDLNRRYQSAGELRDDLHRFLTSRPINARRIHPVVRAIRFVLRHQIAALLAIVIVGGSALGWALIDKDRRVRVEQAEAVKAKAEVEEVKEAVDEALTDKDILKAVLNSVFPGGGAIAEKVAGREIPRPSLPTETLTDFKLRIGTPSDIATRTVRPFYSTVADVNWPSEDTTPVTDIELIDEARAKWADGDAAAAQQLVSQYIASRPNGAIDPEAIQMRTALYAVLGRFDLMLEDANALLDSGAPNGHVWRGLASLMLNQARASLRDFDRAKIADPDKAISWIEVFRGLALLQSENVAQARETFVRVLQVPPGTMAGHLGLAVTARLGLALALHMEEQYQEALVELEQVLKSDPKNVQALTLRGECRAHFGDFEGALRDFKEAISLAGYLPELLARYVAVMNLRDSVREQAEAPAAAEIKARHGTEPTDKSAPPVFKWLRNRMPEGESGAMQPGGGVFQLERLGMPFP